MRVSRPPTFATPFLAQQFCVSPLADQERDRFFVGRYESFLTQPVTLKGNHAVSEITTRFQHRQACIHGRSVDLHGGDRDQRAYCRGCVLRGEFVYSQQLPYELAQARQGDSDQFGAAQKLDCRAACSASSATTARTSTFVATVSFTSCQPKPSHWLRWPGPRTTNPQSNQSRFA